MLGAEAGGLPKGDPMAEHEIVALVPMRHHSERVPGKNYRSLAGKPLYAYILGTLGECESIQRIMVDTDSPVIMRGVRKDFPHVQLVERPQELRGDEVPMNSILQHDVRIVRSKYYLQTHSTNPLLTSRTISSAIQLFLESTSQHDSLFSVTRLQARLWSPEGEPINHDPHELIRTQDLPPLYEENSCLYIFERRSFLTRGNRLGERPLLFEIDPGEALDIDEEIDFQMARCLLEIRAGMG
jgi:CMP-N-acetylneuraminic acid synthetase